MFNKRGFLIFILFGSAIFAANCTSETPSENTAKAPTNANIASPGAPLPIANISANYSNANVAAANIAPPVAAASNSPSAVYAAYYGALLRNDEAALRKTLSEDAVKEWEVDMKESGFKTISETINDYGISPQPPQVKSEKIEGNTAILETINPESKQPTKMLLFRERNEWKIAAPSEIAQINLTPEPKADSK